MTGGLGLYACATFSSLGRSLMGNSLKEKILLNRMVAPDGCWLWTGAVNHVTGYGWIRDPRVGRSNYAHRVSYREFVADIPDDLTVDHLCFQKSCVNPTHLDAVSQRVNTLRCASSPATINSLKTSCPNGHPYVENRRRCLQCHREKERLRYRLSRK